MLDAIREGVSLYSPRTRFPVLRGAPDVVRQVWPKLQGMDREIFLVCILDIRLRMRRLHVVSVGSVDAAMVHPRDVFRPAIKWNATRVIVCHNHPTGDPEPSPDDIVMTRRLQEAGKVLGIPVCDHVIIGSATRWVSLTARGVCEVTS